jgi:hypothetical protein
VSKQVDNVLNTIKANGDIGKRKDQSSDHPGPGFLKTGNYYFILRPLTLTEYKYPGKVQFIFNLY